MTDLVLQASFNSGEWSPNLFARVDIAKYHAGAALLQNFFVDYRGGASTRMGSQYILQAFKSATPVRIITYQAGFNIGYILEFGDLYIRFYYNGSPILETAFNLASASNANPGIIQTFTGPPWSIGDWIYITGVAGMTQLNGRYFSVIAISGTSVTLGDLNGNNVNTTAYTAYISGGTAARVYTLTSPYAAADLALVKFAQAPGMMVLTHPNYKIQILTQISANNWTIANAALGTTIASPTGVVAGTTLAGGQTNYAYVVTAIDASGQESAASAVATIPNSQDIRTVAGTNLIVWAPTTNAVRYNVYESGVSYFGAVPSGVNFGFIGTTTNAKFVDSNIGPDYSLGPPVLQSPFAGNGVAFVSVSTKGNYTTVPTVNFTGGSPTSAATAIANLGATSSPPTITSGGTGYNSGDTINFGNGLVLTVLTVSSGVITSWNVASIGSITSGSTPANPIAQVHTSGTGTGATATTNWGVYTVDLTSTGAGYTSTPSVSFSSGGAVATATLNTVSNSKPSVVSFFQQRLVFAGASGSPQTFYMSQPGSYYNFNVSYPTKSSDAISETLVSGVLQTIKSIVSSTAGMLVLTDKGTWLVNGGSPGSAVSPTTIVGNLQSSVGANDVPPIVANHDALYVSAKGSSVWDLAYNIYFNVFTGTDISVIASHLFFGYTINEWAWAEQPFYVVWAVRSDGTMLTLTYVKEQDFIGWSHQTTLGTYKSVCAVTEVTSTAGTVDVIYTVAQRVVNGYTVQYIERMVPRIFPTGVQSAWCVDAGIQYQGVGALSFTGAEFLAGQTVTGLQTDNLGNTTVITPFTMPTNGFFTLPAPGGGATSYTNVIIGLGFTCLLQTLPIDVSQAQIQGRLKKIPDVTIRVKDTLGLSIGTTFANQVPIKDLVSGNVASGLAGLNSSQVVSGLFTGDAKVYLDSSTNIPGQYCIGQYNPYPATVLGVFPHLVLEDTD